MEEEEEELGFYFIPSDRELIVHYLWQRVAGLPLPSGVISDANVSSTPPWELLAGRQEAYFFSEQKPLGSSRSSRKMESGTWKKESTGKEETAFLDSGAVVHWKKSLFSFHLTGCDYSSGFVMREYQLCGPPGISDERRIKTSQPQSRWVLCKINVSQKALKRRRRREGGQGGGAPPGGSDEVSNDALMPSETQGEVLEFAAEPIELSSSTSSDYCVSIQPLSLQEINQILDMLDSNATNLAPSAGEAPVLIPPPPQEESISVDDYGDYRWSSANRRRC